MSIEIQHIVITGGTSGIGREMVERLQEKNRVTVLARASQKLERARIELADVRFLEADLSDLSSIETAADELIKLDEPIDVLINNAAIQSTPTFLDDNFRFEMIRREIDVNFTAICTLIHLLMPLMLKETPSTIMNINSGLALSPKTSSAIYCATKGALNIFTQSLRYQLEETNINVKQCLLPLVDTDMTVGRGTGKLSASQAAERILNGLTSSKADFDIGKVKILRLLTRISPTLAARIMKAV